jgi:hypothetical protein
MTVSTITPRTTKWTAWRRRGAQLLALGMAGPSRHCGALSAWCTELGRGLVIRSPWVCRRALRALTLLVHHVNPEARYRLTAAGTAALGAQPVICDA